jgi:hypothetical protein
VQAVDGSAIHLTYPAIGHTREVWIDGIPEAPSVWP